jgi:hypothetical protein
MEVPMHRLAISLAAAAALAAAVLARAEGGTPADASTALDANSFGQAVRSEAPASAPQVAAAASEPQQHCWKEYRVGSNFPVTRCESGETEAEKQRRLGDWNRSLTRANGIVHAPGDK